MENNDIDVLIGMLEDGIDVSYDEYDDITYYNFKMEYDEPSSEIKNLLDKIGVKCRLDTKEIGHKVKKIYQTLIIDYGEEQKIKDWLKANKKQVMEYIKTKDKKTIGRFALIFGEALDEDLLKEIINSYNIDENEYHEYDEFGLDYGEREKILSYIKDPIYLKYVLRNSSSLHITIDNFVYTHIIKSINDVNQIKNYIEKTEHYGNYGIAELVISLNEPDYTKKIIEDREKYDFKGNDITVLVISLNEPDYTKKVIEDRDKNDLDGYSITELVKTLHEPEYSKRIIENREKYGLNGYNVAGLVESLNEPEYTKRIIENKEKYGLNGYNVVVLVESLNEPEYTKKIIENREKYDLNEYVVGKLLRTDKDLLKEIIKNKEEYRLSAGYLADFAFKIFLGEELLEFIDKEVSEIYRNKYASIEFIKENLSRFLEIEGVSTIKDVLLQMSEKNDEILKGNFDILNERYINILGVEKVNQISCYSDIANMVLGLNDGELKLLGKVLDKYMDMTKGEEWTPLAKKILENIGSYKELVANQEENENISIDKLIPILIHSNNFDIKTLEDVENFQEIKRKKCEELINGETIEEKQKAILLKVFGQGLRETKKIISKFGKDIEEIEDEDLKAYIKSLQEILKIEKPEVLKEIFEQVEELETINPLLMERMLKTEYCKLYNKDLFNVKDAEKLPDGENLYSAGTDFKMIITSVGAYYTNNSVIDYKKDWNKPKIGSQHFCASYIRNDMLGHAPVPHICYGFCEMVEDSLMLSGPMDLISSGVSFESTARSNERYLAPNNQIANTIGYNEMDFRRIQEGKKKQPDYIVVFRKNGNIPNMDKAEKASKDFGGLPIVVIDEDECLASERKKAEEMFEEYKKTNDPQIGAKLLEKLKNNRVTDYSFCRDTDMDMILQNLKTQKSRIEANVSMEDLEEMYEDVSGEERQGEMEKIRMVYERIRRISERRDNSDGR